MLLRCTGKVLALLRTGRPPVVGEPSAADWYAHLIWVQRRKCLLLTHAGTLFSVLVPDVSVAALRPVGPLVVSAIEAGLRAEGLPVDALGALVQEQVRVGKTVDRRILGTMNDLAFTAEHDIATAGGLDRCDIDALNQNLHRTINSITGYTPPIELVIAAARRHQGKARPAARCPSPGAPSGCTASKGADARGRRVRRRPKESGEERQPCIRGGRMALG